MKLCSSFWLSVVATAGMSFTSCKPTQPLPDIPQTKQTFPTQVFINSDAGSALRLVSPDDCELESGESDKIIPCEYSRDGDQLRVVVKEMDLGLVVYYRVTEQGLRHAETNTLLTKAAASARPPIGKRKLAERILNDLRLLDSGIDQFAIEHNKPTGSHVSAKDIAEYLKGGSKLRDSCAAGSCVDPLGNPYIIRDVDSLPRLSRASFDQLFSVAPEGFWKPYQAE